MKKTIQNIAKENIAGLKDKKITRKEALKKSGYVALAAATTLILLGTPNKAQADSSPGPSNPPIW